MNDSATQSVVIRTLKPDVMWVATWLRNSETESYITTWPWWRGGVTLQSMVSTMPKNLWNGVRCRICTPPQTCSGPVDRCSPPSGCRYWKMPSHATTCSRSWSMSERRRTWGTNPSLNSLLKPWTVPDWRGSRACWNRCDPPTSSSVTVLTTSVDTPEHLGSALTAHHTLRISVTSFKNWPATSGLLNRNARNNLL
jgi:hypothetical protein